MAGHRGVCADHKEQGRDDFGGSNFGGCGNLARGVLIEESEACSDMSENIVGRAWRAGALPAEVWCAEE